MGFCMIRIVLSREPKITPIIAESAEAAKSRKSNMSVLSDISNGRVLVSQILSMNKWIPPAGSLIICNRWSESRPEMASFFSLSCKLWLFMIVFSQYLERDALRAKGQANFPFIFPLLIAGGEFRVGFKLLRLS